MRVSILTVLLVVGLVLGWGPETSQAALLNGEILPHLYPDAYAEGLEILYDATGGGGGYGKLTIQGGTRGVWSSSTGFFDLLNNPPHAEPDITDFDLAAIIDHTGAPVSGAITIVGDLNGDGVKETLWSSTNLLRFGWGAGPSGARTDLFEFVFTNLDGVLAGTGHRFGVVVTSHISRFLDPGGVLPDFTQDFSKADEDLWGVADAYLMPEPSTMALLGLVGLGAVVFRRRR